MKKNAKHKICIYALLAVLTVLFAWLSFVFFSYELVKRTTPQITRAMVQVSKLLPRLEENEQALRNVHDHLEESRRRVFEDNADILEDQGLNDDNIEIVIGHTLSWMDRVTRMRVGREGHVVVISQGDLSILAHSDKNFVGDKLVPAGKFDKAAIPDISEIDEEKIPKNFQLFFPSSFSIKDLDGNRFFDALDAGLYGAAFSYKDTYILCGASLYEAFDFIFVRSFFTTLIFFLIAWVFARYILFSINWHKLDRKSFRGKLTSYSFIAIAILFAAIWYYETIMDVTGDIATMSNHAKTAVETLNTYREYRNELSDWLDGQYLKQCRFVGNLVKGSGKGSLTRKDLAEFAKELDIKYIYVFDKKGKVIVTNSPYDHFEISRSRFEQSYAFRPLLNGREYVIQEPMVDEAGGEKMQYIGVSLRDENDLSDGFVQIAIDPILRERLFEPINVQAVLDNLVIGLPDYAIAINKETMQIVATTGLGYADNSIENIGINVESIKKDFNGIYYIKGNVYYAGVSESEDLYLLPLARGTDNTNSLIIAIKLLIFGIAAFLLLIATGLSCYKSIADEKEDKNSKTAGSESSGNKAETGESGFSRLSEKFDAKKEFYFESRWNKQNAIPKEQRTPEMRTKRIIYNILLIFSTALIIFEGSKLAVGIGNKSHDGFSYVLFGNWQKGVNLFSFSYCLFLLSALHVLQELFNRFLYRIAKVSDLKRETILLLLRNALKYSCALFFLYLGLAKFGIDTRALWASAGVLSLMIGFGAKDLVNDVIAGLFIIFEGTYTIGDFLLIGDWRGTVQEIGLRYTKIGYFSDTKILNNSAIRDFINCNGDVAKEVLNIPVSYETNLLEIEKLLARELPVIAKNVPYLIRPPKYRGVTDFEGNYMLLKINIYCVPIKRRKARRALLGQLKLLFERENIKFPYARTIFMENKDIDDTDTRTRTSDTDG